MSRRHSDSIWDTLQSVLVVLPFWLGPLAAVAAFFLIRYAVPHYIGDPVTNPNARLAALAAPLIAWPMAGGITIAWIGAEIEKWRGRRLFKSTSTAADVRNLTWQQFEQLLVETYRRAGYKVIHSGNACGDGGVDLSLYSNGERTLVQCKHWKTQEVDVKPVRELLGVMTSCGAAAGIVVTSGRFTRGAQRFAAPLPQLTLIDGEALQTMTKNIKSSASRSTSSSLSASSHASTPTCPNCDSMMIQRRQKRDGSAFWGCSQFPACRGTRAIDRVRHGISDR